MLRGKKKKKRRRRVVCGMFWTEVLRGKEGLKRKTEWVRVWRRNLVGKKRKKKMEKKEMPCGG